MKRTHGRYEFVDLLKNFFFLVTKLELGTVFASWNYNNSTDSMLLLVNSACNIYKWLKEVVAEEAD